MSKSSYDAMRALNKMEKMAAASSDILSFMRVTQPRGTSEQFVASLTAVDQVMLALSRLFRAEQADEEMGTTSVGGTDRPYSSQVMSDMASVQSEVDELSAVVGAWRTQRVEWNEGIESYRRSQQERIARSNLPGPGIAEDDEDPEVAAAALSRLQETLRRL